MKARLLSFQLRLPSVPDGDQSRQVEIGAGDQDWSTRRAESPNGNSTANDLWRVKTLWCILDWQGEAIMVKAADIGSLIILTPGVRGGRARISGTGVTVRRIVEWYKLGYSPEEIADELGHVTLAQVFAALTYYHANQEEIEADLSEEKDAAERLEAGQRRTSHSGS
jgi:uncharacterized protein (DUF433 family)